MKRINWNRIIRLTILIGIVVYYFYREFRPTTTGNKKADTELENEKAERPITGELEFE